ncbi:related to lactonohydrolase [Phialocephala subalpina]|uniref:Related to lactonohydrolase n=1 Tax=Phialocephala subalpina TaxID=576137 RepID=A0A1L7XPQ6_9HELO|nr:related to lactonohydrolase [Phialocephala subalpina]
MGKRKIVQEANPTSNTIIAAYSSTHINYFTRRYAMPGKAYFHKHDEAFKQLLDPDSSIKLLLEVEEYPFAHEAGVFFADTDDLFITSNRISTRTDGPYVQISRVNFGEKPFVEELKGPSLDIPMGNGGINYNDGVLFCSQGSMTTPSGLYWMSRSPPYQSHCLISDFYGRQFNSLNDVVVHSDGSIWFTDPIYGYEQGYRAKPELPCQVYRFDPSNKSIRAMADGFGRPNGISFSPGEKVIYITDTDWIHGDGTTDGMRPSSIYAFDITYHSGQPFMTNRRLFAMAADGIPDGIKCDMDGNVYSGCGDGINVWSPGGVLLGIVKIDGGAANFCFAVEVSSGSFAENLIGIGCYSPKTTLCSAYGQQYDLSSTIDNCHPKDGLFSATTQVRDTSS